MVKFHTAFFRWQPLFITFFASLLSFLYSYVLFHSIFLLSLLLFPFIKLSTLKLLSSLIYISFSFHSSGFCISLRLFVKYMYKFLVSSFSSSYYYLWYISYVVHICFRIDAITISHYFLSFSFFSSRSIRYAYSLFLGGIWR